MADSENTEPGPETETIETEEADAGEAQTMDRAAVETRAGELAVLPPGELDERQERLRTERLTGGPNLDAPPGAESEAMDDVPDVEPTETEEPPAES